MSRLTELANEEAERVEGETPEPTPEVETPDVPDETPEVETPDEDETPAPVAPPVENLSDAEIQKRFDKAGRAGEAYLKRVSDILGPTLMADLVQSPLDTIPGFVLTAGGEVIDGDAIDATKDLLGLNAGPDYATNPDTHTCERCNGWGDVLTGAKRPGNELVKCAACNGFGYTPPPGIVPAQIVQAKGHSVNAATGEIAPQPHAPDDPRAAELRALGYTVLTPLGAVGQ